MLQKCKALSLMLLLLFLFANVEIAHSDDWAVKRTDRKQLVQQRLKTMLRQQPFSRYAFRRLTNYYSKGSARGRLVRIYQKKVRLRPNSVSDRVVLARLQVWNGQYAKALLHYQWLGQKRPKWTQVSLSQARCFLALKQNKKALQIFKATLPKLKGSLRKETLKKMFKVVMASTDQAAHRWVLKQLKKLRWSKPETLSFARKLAKKRQIDNAIFFYNKILVKSKGGSKFQLLLEICRAQLDANRFQKAEETLQTARKMRTTHQWLKWELLQLEIEIARKQNKLASFTENLSQKWAKTRKYKKLILLARLYKEIKWKPHAVAKFEKAAKLRPSSLEAHNYLIAHYNSVGKTKVANKHIRLLIRYKTAQPKHYLGLIHSLLSEARHPRAFRWQASWGKRYNSKYKNFPKIRRLKHLYRRRSHYNHPSIRRRSRASWKAFQQRKRAQWLKYATPIQKKSFKEAVLILKSGIQNLPQDWVALKDIEFISEQHGLSSISEKALRKMLLTTGAFPERLSYMKKLLENMGRPKTFKVLISKALKKRNVTPQIAANLASLAFAWSLQAEASTKQKGSQQYLRAKRKICPQIRYFLSFVLKRLSPAYQKRHPFLCAKLYAQANVCGEKRQTVQALKKLEEKHALLQESRNKLIQAYLKAHYIDGMERIIKTMGMQKGKDPWLYFTKNHFSKYLTAHTMRFIVQHLQRQLSKDPKGFCTILEQFCKTRKLCKNIKPAIQRLFLVKNLPPVPLLKVINATSRFNLFEKQRAHWLKTIRQRHKHNTKLLHWLVEHPDLYRKVSVYRHRRRSRSSRWVSTALEQEHLHVLLQAMKARKILPNAYKNWLRQIGYHFLKVSKNLAQKRDLTFQVEEVTKRFRPLHRELIGFYLKNHSYQNHGKEQLLKWLSQEPQIEDLRLFRRYQYRWRDKKAKKEFLIRILKNITRPENVGYIREMSKNYRWFDVQIASIQRLLELRPRDKQLLHNLIALLDSSSQYPKLADSYWLRQQRYNKKWTSLAFLKTFSKNCCIDKADSRQARRLLLYGIEYRSLSKFWLIARTLLKQLDRPNKKYIIQIFQKQPKLNPSQRMSLAEIAFKDGMHEEAIELYQQLLQSPQATLLHHERLAHLLDKIGRFQEATKQWNAYLAKRKYSNPELFFEKQAEQLAQQGQKKLAMLHYYRAYQKSDKSRSPQNRPFLNKLLNEKKELRAWAYWLWSLGSKAKPCLKQAQKQPNLTHGVAKGLLQRNTPYQGPLFFYQPCQWKLHSSAQKQRIRLLANSLIKNPAWKWIIQGTASYDQEPDAIFLAQQRALSLRTALHKHGVPLSQLSVRVEKIQGLCINTSKPKKLTIPKVGSHVSPKIKSPFQCEQYRRQVSIGPKLLTYQAYTTLDADKDGIKDFQDRCPTLSRKRNYRWSRRYYRRSHRSVHRRIKYIRSYILDGCPSQNPQSRILGIRKGFVVLRGGISFGHNRYYLTSYKRYDVLELAAYLKLATSIKKIQIEVQIVTNSPSLLKPKAHQAFRYRRRRYRLSKPITPKSLAHRRATYIRLQLVRAGVSTTRLQIKLIPSAPVVPGAAKKFKKLQRLVRFRIVKEGTSL